MTQLTKSMRDEFDAAISKGEQPKMRRVLALDFGRGWAIFFVVFIHGTIFNAFGGQAISGDMGGTDVNLIAVILMTPFIVLGSWASIFAIVTGAASALSTYNHIVLKKRPPSMKIKSNLIRIIALIIVNFIYLYFFMHPAENIMGEPTQSLITGSIQNLEWIIPSAGVLFHSSAFIMIGFSDFIVTMLCILLFRNGGDNKYKRNFIILSIIMCFILYSAPAFQYFLTPIAQNSYTNGNYIISMLLTWLVGTKHCIFPFAAWAIYGALWALMLTQERTYTKLKKVGKIIIILNTIIMIISIIVNFAMYGKLDMNSGNVQHFTFYVMNLVLQTFLVLWAFRSYEFSTAKRRMTFSKKTVGLRRFGNLSLTCFLIEQPIAALVALLTNTINKDGMSKMYVLIFWTPAYAFGWWVAVRQWDIKKNFKGSLEYLLASIGKSKRNLEGCPDLLCLYENLYEPANLNRDGTPKSSE